MYDCAVGDTIYTVQSPCGNSHSDFECQVGNTSVAHNKGPSEVPLELQTPLSELSCSSDFECQVKAVTSDFQCQAKAGCLDPTRPANKCRTQTKSTETRCQTKTSSSASQCNILSSGSSADFQCQAGRPDGQSVSQHRPKMSVSADFQCQVGASQSDFQCQFNDNVHA
ncbi:unnamed protein product [Lymnaea stagnalis]|uniref:Uncharacterized protein n=1 Tax=Lymnaea stagnalis TaxID=6523 RepID=A0AAV2HJE2_LYMST